MSTNEHKKKPNNCEWMPNKHDQVMETNKHKHRADSAHDPGGQQDGQ